MTGKENRQPPRRDRRHPPTAARGGGKSGKFTIVNTHALATASAVGEARGRSRDATRGQRCATPIYDTVTGELVRVTVMVQDVTVLRRLDELKDNLVNTVAHELRTTLTWLGMAPPLARDERVMGPVYGKLAELLTAHVQRLRDLVEDLLHLARTQEGKVLLRIEAVELPGLLSTVRDAVVRRRGTGGGRGIVEAPAEIETVNADRARMELAVANLASNAVHFAPTGTKVTLRARATETGAARRGGRRRTRRAPGAARADLRAVRRDGARPGGRTRPWPLRRA